MSKKTPPPGLDYVPIAGSVPYLSFGVAQTGSTSKLPMSAEAVVFRRLFPVQRPASHDEEWPQPTCARFDVLLPRWADDRLTDAQALCRAYDCEAFPGLRDIAVIVTLRFPGVEADPPVRRIHQAWRQAVGFAQAHLVDQRQLAVIPILHIPARAARAGPPHVHLLALARILTPSGFGVFSQPLASEAGRPLVEQEWMDWQASHE